MVPADAPKPPIPELPGSWNTQLGGELEQPYFRQLELFVRRQRRDHAIYPPAPETFAALEMTPLHRVRVLLLGQDPYHGAGQAHGLSFSVRHGTRPPPSLRNIFKELHADLGVEPRSNGCLESWAQQGVLLLNTVLTVRAGAAGSHRQQGWERFTDRVIETVNAASRPTVFVLWGNAARRKRTLIDRDRHTILQSPHPSPLSAHRGFFGSRPFSRANAALRKTGRGEIQW